MCLSLVHIRVGDRHLCIEVICQEFGETFMYAPLMYLGWRHNHEEDFDNNDNPFDGISSNMVVDEDNKEPLEVTYPEVLNLCTILNHMVANDK
jgi:hypothetical protein